MAVTRAADGVFGHVALGGKAAGDAVHLLTGGGSVEQQTVQRAHLFCLPDKSGLFVGTPDWISPKGDKLTAACLWQAAILFKFVGR